MSKEKFFFATKSDLLERLVLFELQRPVKYIESEAYDTKEIIIFDSINRIKNLGYNSCGNHNGELYLILDKSVLVKIEEVAQVEGGYKYFVNQMLNKTSIAFWPGGLYKDKYLVGGSVSTISDDPTSVELFKQFTNAAFKGFKKIGRYFIGPEALELGKSIRLVTMGFDEPIEYDLKV
jgi:hypothetical protein